MSAVTDYKAFRIVPDLQWVLMQFNSIYGFLPSFFANTSLVSDDYQPDSSRIPSVIGLWEWGLNSVH